MHRTYSISRCHDGTGSTLLDNAGAIILMTKSDYLYNCFIWVRHSGCFLGWNLELLPK